MSVGEPRNGTEMRSANKAWLCIGFGVVLHNMMAAGRGQEMLSEAVDRWLGDHPVLTRGCVALVSLHLVNALPSRLDPCHLVFVAGGRLSEKLQGGGPRR
jgi:hypothetical protein